MRPLPASLAKHLRVLQRRFPLPGGAPDVRIVRRVPDATYAATSVEDGRATIWIRRETSTTLMLHSLVHEYAHAWAWCCYSDHSDVWGVAYARCYRSIIEDRRTRRPRPSDVAKAVARLESLA